MRRMTGRMAGILVNAPEQVSWLHFQCAGDFANISKADILPTALNGPDVCGMESGQVRKRFLR